MHDAAIAMEQRDLIHEFVAHLAEPGPQSLCLEGCAGALENDEGLEKMMRLDFLAGLILGDAYRLGLGGSDWRFGCASPASDTREQCGERQQPGGGLSRRHGVKIVRGI